MVMISFQHGTTVGMAIAGSLLLHRAMGALVDVIERECTVTAVFDSKDDAWRWYCLFFFFPLAIYDSDTFKKGYGVAIRE